MRASVKLERRTLLVLDTHSATLVSVCHMTPVNKLLYPKVTCESELCLSGFGGEGMGVTMLPYGREISLQNLIHFDQK